MSRWVDDAAKRKAKTQGLRLATWHKDPLWVRVLRKLGVIW